MQFELMDPPPKNRAGIGHLFLVGGFAESPVVQNAIRNALSSKLRVIIPQGVGVAVLKGAVLYGLDPKTSHRETTIGESITLGDAVTRKYHPASLWHRHIEIHIFSSENENDKYVTDPGVEMVGTLSMDLKEGVSKDREIQAKMLFGDTEIKASAMDIATKKTVRVKFDFLNEHNPKYSTKL
ncbi:Heat shock 70 kDa protein 12A [Lepeophtheirus salmonis]|uniref:Heat shock 70 kDa protein 12A n=1 Tax=Lepeophtheirus salmonis TaxID=72036 RepID=A0A7R8CNA3_LEPSM|nr:Heat shock 70 kDa protein 12A [Lepeophtheirus salmonis]CAF2840109.1 Heat shock 70 kDa protein 12A [Lepeophtheirus salmonis]